MPGEQMLVNSAAPNIDMRIVGQSNAHSGSLNGNGRLGYVSTISNGRAAVEYARQLQGMQLQNANSNNSYDVRFANPLQGNGNDYGRHSSGSGRTNGRESSALQTAEKNKLGRTSVPREYVSRPSEILHVPPPFENFSVGGRVVRNAQKIAFHPSHFSTNSFNFATGARNPRFTYSGAQKLNILATPTETPQAKSQNSGRGHGVMPVDGLKSASYTDSRHSAKIENFQSTQGAKVPKPVAQGRNTRNAFQDIFSTQSIAPNLARTGVISTALRPKAGLGNGVQNPSSSLSTNHLASVSASNPVSPALQHFPSNVLGALDAEAIRSNAVKQQDQFAQFLSQGHVRPPAAPHRLSRGVSSEDDSLPKIVACYSLNSETTATSNAELLKLNANAGFVASTKTPGHCNTNLVSSANASANMASPFRQIIVKNIQSMTNLGNQVHAQETVSSTVRNVMLSTEQDKSHVSKSTSSGITSLKSSHLHAIPSKRKKHSPVKSPKTASKTSRKNGRKSAKATSSSKSPSHLQSSSSSLDSWFKSTQTSSLSMHVVGQYPSPIIISKKPRTHHQNIQPPAAMNPSISKHTERIATQSLPFSDPSRLRVVDSTVAVMAHPPTAQTSSSLTGVRAHTVPGPNMVMPRRAATPSKTLFPQSNVVGSRNPKLNCVAAQKNTQKESASNVTVASTEHPLDYSMTTLRNLERSLRGQVQEEPIDLSMPKARSIVPAELNNFSAVRTTVESQINISSKIDLKQLDTPAFHEQNPTVPDTANLDTLCSVALSLSHNRETQTRSGILSGNSTIIHSPSSKSGQAMLQTSPSTTTLRKSTRLAEKQEKRSGSRARFSAPSESGLVAENMSRADESLQENDSSIVPYLEVNRNSVRNETPVFEGAENETQVASVIEMPTIVKQRKKKRKTEPKRSSGKRKGIVIKISKGTGNRLISKRAHREEKTFETIGHITSSIDNSVTTHTETSENTCAGKSHNDFANSIGLQRKHLAQVETSQATSSANQRDIIISNAAQANGDSSTQFQNIAIQNEGKETTIEHIDGEPNLELPKLVDATSGREDVKRDSEAKEENLKTDNLVDVDRLEDSQKDVVLDKDGKTPDEKSQVEIHLEKVTNRTEASNEDELQSEEKEKPLPDKVVNEIFSNEKDSDAALCELNNPDDTNVIDKEIELNGRQDMCAVETEQATLQDDLSKTRNSPNVSLCRLNSDEMKSKFSVISDNELISITPESLDTMIKAKEMMIAAKGELSKTTDTHINRSNEQIIDFVSREKIADLNKTADTATNAKNSCSRMKDEDKETSTEKGTETFNTETRCVLSEKDSLQEEEEHAKSEVIEDVQHESRVLVTPSETELPISANKDVGSEINTEENDVDFAAKSDKELFGSPFAGIKNPEDLPSPVKNVDVDRPVIVNVGCDNNLLHSKTSGQQQDGVKRGLHGRRKRLHPGKRSIQEKDLKATTGMKNQAENIEGGINENAVATIPTLSYTQDEIVSNEANGKEIVVSVKERKETSDNKSEAPKRRCIEKVKKVPTSKRGPSKRKKGKKLRFTSSKKSRTVSASRVISPIVGNKRLNFDSDSSTSAIKKRTALKLGYNTNASWAGGELKIKRRKLIKKETDSFTVPKSTPKKSAFTYILLSDSSDSSEEGTDVISTTKAKKRVKRKERVGLETSVSLPMPIAGKYCSDAHISPKLELTDDTFPVQVPQDVLASAMPRCAESEDINKLFEKHSSSVISNGVILQDASWDTVSDDQNNTTIANKTRAPLSKKDELKSTISKENCGTLYDDITSEKCKTLGELTEEFSTQTQMFTSMQKSDSNGSSVISGPSLPSTSLISTDAASEEAVTLQHPLGGSSFFEDDTTDIQLHLNFSMYNSCQSASEDSDKPKPATIRLKSFVRDPYTPGTDDFSDASSENINQHRVKTSRTLYGKKGKKNSLVLSKRHKLVSGPIILKGKRQNWPPQSLIGSKQMRNQKLKRNSKILSTAKSSIVSRKQPVESLKELVDSIILTGPKKKSKRLANPKSTKGAVKRSAKAKATKRSNPCPSDSVDNSSGEGLNEPTVSSVMEEETPLLHKSPVARMTGRWKTYQWPDVTKVANRPLPFYQPEVLTKQKREDGIFLTMQKLLKMGVITDQKPRISSTTARKSMPKWKQEEFFVQAKASDARTSALRQQKKEGISTQNSVHCILGEGVVIKPCSVVVKKLNIQRNTVRLL